MLTSPSFPQCRSRRLRHTAFIRALAQENRLHPTDLIYPVFVVDQIDAHIPIESMPGVFRQGQQALLESAAKAVALGIQAICLFPCIEAQYKQPDAAEALNPQGLIPNCIRLLKQKHPQLGVISDVALDPYTSHGHDGVIDAQGQVLNDPTVHVLQQQAKAHAEAGADIVAPSDMMDGRIAAIRNTLEQNQFHHTAILAYSAKYASALYGPFRQAVGSDQSLTPIDKKSYQMNCANLEEALHEAQLDIQEGADMLMVKPAMAYLDVLHRIKTKFELPTLAYQVSGEFSMLKLLAQQQGIEPMILFLESLLGCKRAGACATFSYAALEVAQALA